MSDCTISKVRSLPLSDEDFGKSLGQCLRDCFERFVEQQAFGADRKRAAERGQLLLASAQQQRLAVTHPAQFSLKVSPAEAGMATFNAVAAATEIRLSARAVGRLIRILRCGF